MFQILIAVVAAAGVAVAVIWQISFSKLLTWSESDIPRLAQ
jgi:hypothetical protein